MKNIILIFIFSMSFSFLQAQSSDTYILGTITQPMAKKNTIYLIDENGVETELLFEGFYPKKIFAEFEVELIKQTNKLLNNGYILLDTKQYGWGNGGDMVYYTRYIYTKIK